MFNMCYYIIYSLFTIYLTCNGLIPSITTKSGNMPSLRIIKFTLLKNLHIKYLCTHIVTCFIYAKTYQTHNTSIFQRLWEKSHDNLISCFVMKCSMSQGALSIHLPHFTGSDQVLHLYFIKFQFLFVENSWTCLLKLCEYAFCANSTQIFNDMLII
jgi:hypothetical protein